MASMTPEVPLIVSVDTNIRLVQRGGWIYTQCRTCNGMILWFGSFNCWKCEDCGFKVKFTAPENSTFRWSTQVAVEYVDPERIAQWAAFWLDLPEDSVTAKVDH